MTTLRVLFDVTWEHGHGGTSRYVRSLADALAARPDVELVRWRAPHLERLPRLARAPLNALLHLLATQLALPVVARRWRVDLVHATMIAPLVAPCPVVVTLLDALDFRPALRSSELWSAYVRLIGAPAARRADLAIAPSVSAAADVRAAYRLPGERVRVIPLGSALAAPDAARLPAELPERWALLVGSVSRHKDVRAAIDAVARARCHDPALGLVVVGHAGPLEAGERSWVRELAGVDDATLAALYAHAVVTLIPSRHEGYGLPAVESLALGTPVAGWDIPALREVSAGVARLVPLGDVAALASAIERILADPAGERARIAAAPAAHPLPWSRVAELTLAAYRAVRR